MPKIFQENNVKLTKFWSGDFYKLAHRLCYIHRSFSELKCQYKLKIDC